MNDIKHVISEESQLNQECLYSCTMKKDESVQLNATQSIREGSGSLQSYVF